ncbi:hypothetical protein AWR27_02750 [Spirosoma montaniterrae]|uniref:DUF2834 domain-containing protein n=2 Tax=Spirosoma montaniterrae TaxID=1178516 RepID=A0A1P9X3R6_9BACT|nr:hypothetical protein AWR27_02750 [Spirosoma montaniterrae]
MSLKNLYLLGFIAGTVLPLSQFIPFLLEHGFNFPLFFEQLWINRISSFFGWDVFVSVAVILVFITAEGHRLSQTERWLCYIASVVVGGSAGLPLFLYLRERAK